MKSLIPGELTLLLWSQHMVFMKVKYLRKRRVWDLATVSFSKQEGEDGEME